MGKTVTIRLDERAYEILRSAAVAERRSIANLIETAALRHVEEEQFTDAAEGDWVRSNRDLLHRLERAHGQTKQRKGSFVSGL